jgi:hypothetical protein
VFLAIPDFSLAKNKVFVGLVVGGGLSGGGRVMMMMSRDR